MQHADMHVPVATQVNIQPAENNLRLYLPCNIYLFSVLKYPFNETVCFDNQSPVVSGLRAHRTVSWSWLNRTRASLENGCNIFSSYISICTC